MKKALPALRQRFRQVVLALAAGTLIVTASAAPAEIGTMTGRVEVQRANIPNKWFRARPGIKLGNEDSVRTGDDGQVELTMAQGSDRVNLRSGSRMKAQVANKNWTCVLDYGLLKCAVEKLENGKKFEVVTPIAVASVRGTAFEVGYEKMTGRGYVDVTEGTVLLTQDGKEVKVKAGKRLEFAKDVPLGRPQSSSSPRTKNESKTSAEQTTNSDPNDPLERGLEKLRQKTPPSDKKSNARVGN